MGKLSGAAVSARVFLLILAGLQLVGVDEARSATFATWGDVKAESHGFATRPRPREPFAELTFTPSSNDYARKWEKVLESAEKDQALVDGCILDSSTCPPGARGFVEIVEAARQRDGRARIGEVNRALNLGVQWTSDMVQHGVSDVWSSALTTLSSGKGDCEDYAIAKYLVLIALGFSREDLRLVIVRDKRLHSEHAVLTVRFDNQWLVLDNRHLLLLEDVDLLWQYSPMAVFTGNPGLKTRGPSRLTIRWAADPRTWRGDH
jgi:predicted transglutaminase-like cysteine proteinase